jgi:DNA-binding response OmpR family regulator
MKGTTPKTILIIDDYLSIADALRLVLEDEGYHVEVWLTAEPAYSLQKPFPDLIFLDILLGGIDGKVICRQLKELSATRSVPIILMSANKHLPQIAHEVGADDWLLKPFDLDVLFALLDKHT